MLHTTGGCQNILLAIDRLAAGCVIATRLNAPGSWHDSHVAQPIYEMLCTGTPDGYYLVADMAFP